MGTDGNDERQGTNGGLERTGPITREELYEFVWSEPLWRAAQIYGVTDVAVSKWCRKLRVPKPDRGYWQQLKAGQKKRRPPLPAHREGDPLSVPRPRRHVPRPLEDKEQLPPPPGLDRFCETLQVPAELERPHRLIRRTRSAFRKAHSDNYGILSPKEDESLLVRVSRAQVDRALRIMDTLLKALESAGYKVTSVSERDRYGFQTKHTSFVTVEGEEVPFHLIEKRRRKERGPTERERKEEERWSYQRGRKYYEYSSTGNLSFVLGSPGHYGSRGRVSDTKTRPLEDRLFEIVELILRDAVARRAERIAAQERRKREEEERIRREELERQRRLEMLRRVQLRDQMERWALATRLRAFLAVVEKQRGKEGAPSESAGRFADWLNWAKRYADEIDPLHPPSSIEATVTADPASGILGDHLVEDIRRIRTTLDGLANSLPWRLRHSDW